MIVTVGCTKTGVHISSNDIRVKLQLFGIGDIVFSFSLQDFINFASFKELVIWMKAY